MIDELVNSLNVIYEDNHIIVVEKFENILSQKDETNDVDMNSIVMEYIKKKYNKPGNVYLGLLHRLDRRVGGVMVFAKTSKAASRMSNDIRNHLLNKYYLCLVKGFLDEGQYFDYLYKDEKLRLSKIATKNHKGAKEAILKYKKISVCKINNIIHTYLLIELITGRYNQIRCQMAYHGHPLVNDYKYGYGCDNGSIGLWCYKISFIHPVTKSLMEFTCKPKDGIWANMEG